LIAKVETAFSEVLKSMSNKLVVFDYFSKLVTKMSKVNTAPPLTPDDVAK